RDARRRAEHECPVAVGCVEPGHVVRDVGPGGAGGSLGGRCVGRWLVVKREAGLGPRRRRTLRCRATAGHCPESEAGTRWSARKTLDVEHQVRPACWTRPYL